MADDRTHRNFGLFVVGKTMPQKTWEADYFKLVDKDKVEIYRYAENAPATGLLVAIISLDKGQNVSEITD
jgi:hypothetical protein